MKQKIYKLFFIFSLIVSFSLNSQDMNAQAKMPEQKMNGKKQYKPKDYTHLFGMQGFSDELLKMHFSLYEKYVINVNLLNELLAEYLGRSPDYQYQALKLRFAWEFDGMRLHEYYFDNLGGKKSLDPDSDLYGLIARDFGSFENWKKDFISTGMTRGIGYSVLYFDPEAGRLFNTWINEHDLGHLATGKPILIMDVFEHAYMPQYGLDRAKYIEAFFKNINWEVVSSRLPSMRE